MSHDELETYIASELHTIVQNRINASYDRDLCVVVLVRRLVSVYHVTHVLHGLTTRQAKQDQLAFKIAYLSIF